MIVSGGAIGSPQLLLLSGIGPAEQLRGHGIDVVHDQPEVGRNLRDHPMALGLWETSLKNSLFAAEKPAQLLKLLFQRRGLLTSNVGEAAAFLRSREDLTAPDLELIFAPVLYLKEGLEPPDAHGFTIAAVCLRPQSVGRLTLRSADPLEQPDIDPAFMTSPEDVRVLEEGVRQMRRIVGTPPLMDVAELERAPGGEETEAWIRETAHTIYHPVGTCRLGAVVDDHLRVTGVDNVRVVDGSVLPNLMRGHSHAQISMVALRAAEKIRRPH